MALTKFKWMFLGIFIGFFIIYTVLNYLAFYDIQNYWLMILFEIIGITFILVVFMLTNKLPMMIEQDGYMQINEKPFMKINDEGTDQTINRILANRAKKQKSGKIDYYPTL